MARKNDCWGIEVGQYAIKAMRLTRSGNDAHLIEWDYLPFKQVLSTPDINVDEAVQVGLDQFLVKHPDAERSQIVVSVPGHLAFARFAKLPPVEPKKIPSIVGYEAQQQIPFPIDQVEWDYQVFQQADSPDVEVGIFAITKERVLTFLSNYRAVGMRIDQLTLSPLAVYNAFAFDNAENTEELEGTVYMDIGTVSTDVIIVESGGIWLRTLPIGGNHFTEALVKAFKISFAKAERYKREAATSKYSRQIFSAMRPVFADLVQEIQRSIGYYQSLNRDAELHRMVCVGSTFKLPGLGKFLKQQLQMKVVRPDRFKRLDVAGKQEAEFSTRVVNLAPAYGLALQGLGLESVSANILPGYILKQRIWKAKQPWIAAAAACIAIGAGLAGGRFFMEQSAVADARDQTEQAIRPVESRARNYIQRFDSLEGANQTMRLENMRRILDYRNLWPLLLEDITAAALATNPQPVTLTSQYEQIEQIPRNQRRRIYIERIEAQYRAAPEQAASSSSRSRSSSSSSDSDHLGGKYDVDDFWKTDDKAGRQADDEQAAAPQQAAGPYIVVTVHGSLPYKDNAGAASFLNQTFLNYLKQHTQQEDRPYRIVLGENPIISLSRVTVQDPNARSGRNAAPSRTTPGRNYEPAAGSQRSSSASAQLDQLYPPRPLAEEDRSEDSQFVIQFTVELASPDRARTTEPSASQALRQPAAPPADEPEARRDAGAARQENPS